MDLAILGIVIDPAGAKGGGKEAEAAFASLKAKATESMGRIQAASAGLTSSIFNVRNAVLSLGAAFAARQVVSTVSEFSRTLSVLTAVTGAAAEQIDVLRAAALKLGSGQKAEFGPNEIASAMRELAQAGLTVNQVMAAIPATLDLAVAANIDLRKSAEVTKSVMEAFGKSADQVRGIIDVMAVTSNKTATDIGAMGEAMKYVAPITNALHISLEETSAAMGVLANNGIQGSMAGTSLKAVLSALASPSSQARAAIQGLGLTIKDLDPQTHSLTEIINTLALAGLDAGRAFEIFSDRAAPAIVTLVSKAPQFTKLAGELKGVAGASKEMADTIHDNLLGDLKALQATIQAATIASSDRGLTGGLRSATQQATALIEAVAGLSDPLDHANAKAYALVETLKLVGAAVAGFLAYKLAVGILEIATATGVLVSSLASLRLAIVANPIGAVAVAIGAVTAAFIAYKYSVTEADHELEAHMATIKRHKDLIAEGGKASTSSLEAEIEANDRLARSSAERNAALGAQIAKIKADIFRGTMQGDHAQAGGGELDAADMAKLKKQLEELSSQANLSEGQRLMALRYRAEAEKQLNDIQLEGLRKEAGISSDLEAQYLKLKDLISKNETDPDRLKKMLEALDARFAIMKQGKAPAGDGDGELTKFANSLDVVSAKTRTYTIFVGQLDEALKAGLITRNEYDESLAEARLGLDATPLKRYADALDTASARTHKYNQDLVFLKLALKENLITAEDFARIIADMNRELADGGAVQQFVDGLDVAESRFKSVRREQEKLDEALKEGKITAAGYAEAQIKLADSLELAGSTFNRSNRALIQSFSVQNQAAAVRAKSADELNRRLERGEMTREEAFRYGVAQSVTAWGNAQQQMADAGRQFVQSMDSGFSAFFDSMLDDIGNVGSAFKGLVSSILKDMARLVIQQQVERPLLKAIFSAAGSYFGGGTGSGPVGDFGAGYNGASVAGVAHGGGIAGSGALGSRQVNSRLFAGARRFHGGGIAGDEVPIIARKGEGVFTPEQMAAMGGGGTVIVKTEVNLNGGKVSTNTSASGDDQAQAARIARGFETRMRGIVMDMMRPGEPLYSYAR